MTTFFSYGEDDVVFIGKGRIVQNYNESYEEYKKCIYNGQILQSRKYKKVILTDDTMIQLKSEKFCQIMEILKKESQCYLKVSEINIFEEKPFNVPHIEKLKSQNLKKYEVIPVTYVICKVIHVNVGDDRYLCKMPNNYEIQ